MHFGLWLLVSLQAFIACDDDAHGFEDVLINPLIVEWLQIVPVKGRLSSGGAAAKYY
jgi:fumarate reductase subunit C